MNKKIVLGITIGAAGCIAAAYAGSSWYAGTQIEKRMNAGLQELAKTNPLIKVSDISVKRGIFKTTHEMSIGLNADCFAQAAAIQKQSDLKSLENLKIRLRQEISHGPVTFGDGVRPGLAAYSGALVLDESTAREVRKIIGEQPVFSWKGHLAFNGDYTAALKSPRFEFDGKEGKAVWEGMNGTAQGNMQTKTYRVDLLAPKLSFSSSQAQANQPGTGLIENIRFAFTGQEGKSKVALGSGMFSVDKVAIAEGNAPDKGMFMTRLVYSADVKENGGYIDMLAGYKIDDVRVNIPSVGDKSFGPVVLELGMEHLHAQSVGELNSLANQFMCLGKNPGESAEERLKALKELMVVILKNDPVLRLKQLKLGAPAGDVQVQGKLAVAGLQPALLDNPQTAMKHVLDVVTVELDGSASESLLMSFAKDGAVSAAQRQMALAPGESMPAEHVNAVQTEAEQSAKEKLALAVAQNFVKVEGNRINASFSYSKGKPVLNGQPIQLPFLPGNDAAALAAGSTQN